MINDKAYIIHTNTYTTHENKNLIKKEIAWKIRKRLKLKPFSPHK